MNRLWIKSLALLLLPGVALAHDGGHSSGLMAALLHPFSGIDHLLALLAVGLWAAQQPPRQCWPLPAGFLLALLFGAALAIAGTALPLVEAGIGVSLLLVGLLVATALRLPTLVSTLLVGSFALFHGYAHGAEMVPGVTTLLWFAGIAASSLLLLVTGVIVGQRLQQLAWHRLMRLIGGAIAISGCYLVLV